MDASFLHPLQLYWTFYNQMQEENHHTSIKQVLRPVSQTLTATHEDTTSLPLATSAKGMYDKDLHKTSF